MVKAAMLSLAGFALVVWAANGGGWIALLLAGVYVGALSGLASHTLEDMW